MLSISASLTSISVKAQPSSRLRSKTNLHQLLRLENLLLSLKEEFTEVESDFSFGRLSESSITVLITMETEDSKSLKLLP